MTDQQITFIARSYTSPYHSIDDLLQEGRILVFTHPELTEEQLIKKLKNKFQTLSRAENRRRAKLLPLSYAENVEARKESYHSLSELETMLAMGYTHKEIALQMGVSTKTIQRQLQALRATYTKSR